MTIILKIRAMLSASMTPFSACAASALFLFCASCTSVQRPLSEVRVPDTLEIARAAPLGEGTLPPISAASIRKRREWPAGWVNTWVPLESWSKFNSLRVARVNATDSVYELQTPGGPLAVKVGSKIASYRGLFCWLGFAPQMIGGVPCLHWLDAKKNLQPCLAPVDWHGKSQLTVVIDPGHGGADGGAASVFNGAHEKSYTLDWALKLAELLRARGWTVLLTRTGDSEVSLQQRVAVADRSNAGLFISLHFNSGGGNRDLAGVETYCLTPTGLPSSLVREFEDDPALTFPNNAFDESNLQLALALHQGVLQTTRATDRGVRRARFMGVLRGQKRPAVLIEGGYLSNNAEARKIHSAEYRSRLAEGVVAALLDFAGPAVTSSSLEKNLTLPMAVSRLPVVSSNRR